LLQKLPYRVKPTLLKIGGKFPPVAMLMRFVHELFVSEGSFMAIVQEQDGVPKVLCGILWDQWIVLPGGARSKTDEGPEITAVRETRDEVGLIITEYYSIGTWSGPKRWFIRRQPIKRHLFRATAWEGEVRIDGIEVKESRWLSLRDVEENNQRIKSEMLTLFKAALQQ